VESMPLGPNAVLLVARALVVPRNGRVICKIMNASDKAITLRHGFPLAKLELAEDSVIASLDLDGTDTTDGARRRQGQRSEVNATEQQRRLDAIGIKLCVDNLTADQQARLRTLLDDNISIFATELRDLPGTDWYVHHIETGDAQPIRKRAYRHSPEAQREIQRQVQEMLDAGIIRESQSAWQAPVLLVKKKNGTARLCIDFRALNTVVKPMFYPLPVLEQVLDQLGDAPVRFISSCDLKSGYHQIKLDEESCSKTAFVTGTGCYEFTRTPFGLATSPSGFSLLMGRLFQGLDYRFCLCYLDDILIFSPDFDTHLRHLQRVFDRIREANLRLNPSKCSFAAKECAYLGVVLTPEGVKTDESKIQVVKNYPRPHDVKTLKAFLGFAAFYR
jgi:hypothetical protein